MGKIDCENWIQSGQSIMEVRQSLGLGFGDGPKWFLTRGML